MKLFHYILPVALLVVTSTSFASNSEPKKQENYEHEISTKGILAKFAFGSAAIGLPLRHYYGSLNKFYALAKDSSFVHLPIDRVNINKSSGWANTFRTIFWGLRDSTAEGSVLVHEKPTKVFWDLKNATQGNALIEHSANGFWCLPDYSPAKGNIMIQRGFTTVFGAPHFPRFWPALGAYALYKGIDNIIDRCNFNKAAQLAVTTSLDFQKNDPASQKLKSACSRELDLLMNSVQKKDTYTTSLWANDLQECIKRNTENK